MRTLLLAIIAPLLLLTSPAGAQRLQPSAIPHVPHAVAKKVSFPASEPLAHLLALDCDTDRSRGRETAAANHSGSGWLAGGFVSGVLLGLIGTAVTFAMANSSTAQPDRIPDGAEASCFRDGYSSRARSINTSSALTGGLLGTAVLILIVVSASSGSTY